MRMSALPTQPLTMSSMLNQPTICRGCNKRAVDVGYKSCSSCRAKRKEQKVASQEKKKLLVSLENAELQINVNEMGTKNSEAAEKPKKRKAEDGGEGAAAVKKKKTMKMFLKNANRTPIDFDASSKSDESIEFQTASALYKRLKKLASREKSLEFLACHSIVADPVVNNAKRASLVARDIRKVAGLSFNSKQTSTPPIHFHNSHILRYQCTCAVKAASSASTNGTDPKLQHTGLASWVSSQGEASASVKECDGVIEVTVADDNSHPLGFAGQKISIKVRHAKKST